MAVAEADAAPAPAPAPATADAAADAAVLVREPVAVGAGPGQSALVAAAQLPESVGSADAEVPAPVGWPCTRCGELAPLEAMECPLCGAGFLAGVDGGSTIRVPGVGVVESLTNMQKFGVAAVGAAVIGVACFVLLLIFSAVF